jgi:hypothetical protein
MEFSTFKFYIVYCFLQRHMSISKKCKIILMSMMHSLYDYKIHLEAILCIYLSTNIFILGCCILFLVAVFNNFFDNYFLFAIFNKDLFDQKYKYTLQNNTSNNIDNTIISSLNYDIGGGQKHIFTYEPLLQYVSPVSDMEYNPDDSFTFLSNCSKSVALDLCKQKL